MSIKFGSNGRKKANPFIQPSVCLPVCLLVYPYVSVSVRLFAHPSIALDIAVFQCFLFTFIFFYLFTTKQLPSIEVRTMQLDL